MKELQEWLGTLRGIYSVDKDLDGTITFCWLSQLYLQAFELYNITYIDIRDENLRILHPDIITLRNLKIFNLSNNPDLILTQSQADFISSIQEHSDLSKFTIIPDSDLAKDLFL